MSDYIDKSNLYKSIADREEEYRSALLKEKDYNTASALQLQGLLNATTLIKHLVFDYPTVEADPVRHGQWLISLTGWLYCSECKGEPPCETNVGTDYCPNCGAKMDRIEERLLMPKADGSTIKIGKEKKMRLIDADRFKNWLMENYVLYDGGRSLKDIDSQPTVEAIPIEWIKEWVNNYCDREQEKLIEILLRTWNKNG